MIRKMQTQDMAQIMRIWCDTNIKAHEFIPKVYWLDNMAYVESALGEAEVYVYELDAEIVGFIGLSGDYVAGIFVPVTNQSKGYGRHLLNHVKTIKSTLTLHVYQKNYRAVAFYEREGFVTKSHDIDANTNEKELFMQWPGMDPNLKQSGDSFVSN